MDTLLAETAYTTTHEFVVGWGTLSLINAGLAQSKGHSRLVWWLLSLLLGPVATFLIVVFLQRTSAPVEIPSVAKPPRDPDLA
jgi:hypothetical protein